MTQGFERLEAVPGPHAPDMAAAESEHNVKVPGTKRFHGGRPSHRPARDMAAAESEHNVKVPGTKRFAA